MVYDLEKKQVCDPNTKIVERLRRWRSLDSEVLLSRIVYHNSTLLLTHLAKSFELVQNELFLNVNSIRISLIEL